MSDIRKPAEGEVFIESPDAQQSEYKKLRPLFYSLAFGLPDSTINTLATTAGMTVEEARKLLDQFCESYRRTAEFTKRYAATHGDPYILTRHGRRRHFNVPHNEPSTRFDPKPPQTTSCGQCMSDCTRWDAISRRWFCTCGSTCIIQDIHDQVMQFDFAKAELRLMVGPKEDEEEK